MDCNAVDKGHQKNGLNGKRQPAPPTELHLMLDEGLKFGYYEGLRVSFGFSCPKYRDMDYGIFQMKHIIPFLSTKKVCKPYICWMLYFFLHHVLQHVETRLLICTACFYMLEDMVQKGLYRSSNLNFETAFSVT